MDFTTTPIIFGAVFGVFFLLVFMCMVARLCGSKSRSERYRQQYINTVDAAPHAVPHINAQFNMPIAALPRFSAPVANYPMGPGHQYPAHLTPNSYQQHYQNSNSGAVGDYTSSPVPPRPNPDAPPSYSEVVACS